MKKLLSTNKGVLLLYGLIMVGLTSLCLLFLIGGIYEISAVLAISSVSSFVVLVIMLYGQLEKTEDGYKAGKFIALSVVRFIFMAAGIALSAVMLYLTNDGAEKSRLFYSILSIIPIGVCLTLYTFRGKSE